jgi:ABC-type multidrug transport system fused ATPase/permease subunit
VILLQSQVSVKRIQDFLAEDEVPDWVSSLKRHASSDEEPTKIGFENATLRWNSGNQPDTTVKKTAAVSLGSSTSSGESTAVEEPPVFSLSDLHVDFPLGKLSVITGPTGSGKTAILTALLGEMELLSGKSYLPKNNTKVDTTTGLRDSIAYCAQTPWLQQRSIKDNILFGDGFDEKRYEETLEACALWVLSCFTWVYC